MGGLIKIAIIVAIAFFVIEHNPDLLGAGDDIAEEVGDILGR